MKNLQMQLAVVLLFTLCLLNGAYGQITPSQDAYTNSADPTTNYGTAVTLGVVSSATSIQSTYIQFDLSSIPAGYTSANVAKATLKLYVNAVATAGSFNVDYVNGTWTEKTIKASLAPALGGTIMASVPLASSNVHDYVLIDVTSAVGAWLDGTQTNDGIALVANSPLSATIDSKESTTQSHPAELDVVFNGAITGITTASGSGLTGGGTSGTLNLSLTNACAANQVLQYNGSSWACAAVGTGTVTRVGSGAGLTGGPITGSGTLSIPAGGVTNAMLATSYAQLGATNTFAANQTVNGTLTANGSSTGINGVDGNTSSSAYAAAGVAGYASATTGSTLGVLGQSASPGGWGVEGNSPFAGVVGINNGGYAFSTVGAPFGVLGSNSSVAVYGASSGVSATGGSISPHATGVWGDYGGAPATGYGVLGTADGNWAGAFYSNSSTLPTLFGLNFATTGSGTGVYGNSASTIGYGVEGDSAYVGVIGTSSASSGFGVAGNSPYVGVIGAEPGQEFSNAGLPYGVVGASPTTTGVYGASSGVSATGGTTGHGVGVWGDNGGADSGAGVLGTADNNNAGVFINNSYYPAIAALNETTTAGGAVFEASLPNLLTGDASAIFGDPGCGETSGNMALQLGQTGMSSCANYTMIGNTAGSTYINAVTGQTVHLRIANADRLTVNSGGVGITGNLNVSGTKSFRIDHPLDPANKYLFHAAIESSEVLNLYSGNAVLDDSGAAVVQLPDWFEAVNKDFRYQLTPIGAPGQGILYIAEEVSGGHFKIAGGKPGAKVSWQVSGVRNDAWEKAYPMVVEADKGSDRGHYLTPELYGQPETARIGYMAPAPGSEQVAHHQHLSLHSGNASPARTITLPAPPNPVLPKVAPSRHVARLSHPAQASKPELNQR